LLDALLLLAPLALAQAAPAAGASRDLTIVVRADAAAPEKLGARELADHLERMTGRRAAVVVESEPLPERALIVGPCLALASLGVRLDRELLGEEGFLLKSVRGRLVVAGPGSRGTLYACVTLLEKLGVRWYTPRVTRVPKRQTIDLEGFDDVEVPDFEYRDVGFAEAFERGFAYHNRLNGFSQQLDAETGGKWIYRPFVHSFDELVPRSLFAEHPDYFPFDGEKRIDGYVQRCLSNPDVLKIATATVLRWIAEHPEARIFSVSQNDTYNECKCPECRKLVTKYDTWSGLYLWFVNQVAEAVGKEHPGVLIDTLAYQFTETPPKGIAPLKNVRVRLCPIGCCASHPYENCDAKPTVAFLTNLRLWAGLTDTLYVWHYATDFSHYLMPFPDFDEFPAELKLYRASGVKGVYFEGDYSAGGGGSDAELRSWVMAHLLFDVHADVGALVDDWMSGVYGRAAKPMRDWFDLLHAAARTPDRHLFIYDPPEKLFTRELLEAGERLFDAAARAAQDDPLASAAVAKARLGIRYVRIVEDPKPSPDFDSFVADLRRFGVTQVAEGRTVDAFEAEWRKTHGATKSVK
jgi:uncharacterized protein DUF4838/glycosyl hydrolase family 67